jgi:hypothetical protein
MNKFILTVLSALCLFACACKKDKQQKKASDLYLTANKDNANWVTNWHTFGEVGGAKNYQLIGNKGEEHLYIKLTMNNLNQFVLDNDKTEFHITIGLDAVAARYVLDNGTTNTVNVTNYDAKSVIMEGNFQLKFKKLSGLDGYPATVTFTDGKFKVSKAYD